MYITQEQNLAFFLQWPAGITNIILVPHQKFLGPAYDFMHEIKKNQ